MKKITVGMIIKLVKEISKNKKLCTKSKDNLY